MFNDTMKPHQIDGMQLGWVIAWVLSPGQDYHERKFEDLPQHLQESEVLRCLIINGQSTDQEDFIFNNSLDSIRSILNGRNV